jgi:hypothetical protein
VRQKIRDVSEMVAVRAVEVRPVMELAHLVYADAFEVISRGLDRVEESDRLAVGERHDEIGAGTDVVEDGVGDPWLGDHPRRLGVDA